MFNRYVSPNWTSPKICTDQLVNFQLLSETIKRDLYHSGKSSSAIGNKSQTDLKKRNVPRVTTSFVVEYGVEYENINTARNE